MIWNDATKLLPRMVAEHLGYCLDAKGLIWACTKSDNHQLHTWYLVEISVSLRGCPHPEISKNLGPSLRPPIWVDRIFCKVYCLPTPHHGTEDGEKNFSNREIVASIAGLSSWVILERGLFPYACRDSKRARQSPSLGSDFLAPKVQDVTCRVLPDGWMIRR